MYAIEFQAKVKNGTIEVPEEYKDQLTGLVRVIVLAQSQPSAATLIDHLLENPIKLLNFKPLSREEVYERR